MSRHRPVLRTHRRPMAGWWRRDAFFVRYMLRVASALALLAYAAVLLAGLVALVQGEAAFEAWRAALRSPWSIALHALALPLLGYHSLTWFQVMPKTLPPLPVSARTVTALGLALVLGVSVAVLALVVGMAP